MDGFKVFKGFNILFEVYIVIKIMIVRTCRDPQLRSGPEEPSPQPSIGAKKKVVWK